MNPSASSPETLLRLPQVIARVSLSRSSIYKMMKRTPPAFPTPLKISRRAVAWNSSAIDRFIEERIAAGGQ